MAAYIDHLVHLCKELQHRCVIALPAGLAGFGNDVQLGIAIDRGDLAGVLNRCALVLLLPLQTCPRASVLLTRFLLLLLLLMRTGHSAL